jgi:hypothetical protein
MSEAAAEYLVTYPGFDGPETRGIAYLAVLERALAVVGELDDNPGRGTVDAIELIAEGLIDSNLVADDFTLLHYLRQDHVRSGRPALWQIRWNARDGAHATWRGKPSWEPVPAELHAKEIRAFELVDAHAEWTAEALDRDVRDVIDLLSDEDLIAGIQTSFADDPSSYVWNEIAELAFDSGARYEEGSGTVTVVRSVERRGRDRWVAEVDVSLDVTRPEGDHAETSGYRVILELHGRSPTLPRDVVLIG